MRKIDKTNKLATAFHAIIDGHEAAGTNHPNYTAGPFRSAHYESVFMNLVVCQNGLCAYTEDIITTKTHEIAGTWEDGKYSGEYSRKDFDGSIDHYESALKTSKGWLFGNLFAVSTFINTHKLQKNAATTFKPDGENYDPYTYLRYHFPQHIFIPNPEYVLNDEGRYNEVKGMIHALGLNLQTIIDKREAMLEDYKIDILNGQKTYEEIEENELKRFYTAYAMSRDALEGAN